MQIELISSTPDPEDLIEFCARVCYKSKPGKSYIPGSMIRTLLSQTPPHDSIVEHAYATFHIKGISRACSHQLVRHRLCTYHQASQRYCSEIDCEYIVPPTITDEQLDEFHHDMRAVGSFYKKWIDKGLKREDARCFLPNACATELVMTTNFRQWRHIIELRCDNHAQLEIRNLFRLILGKLYEIAPNVFGDLFNKFIVEPK